MVNPVPIEEHDNDYVHRRYIELDDACKRRGTSIHRIIEEAVIIEMWLDDLTGGGGKNPPCRPRLGISDMVRALRRRFRRCAA